MLDPCVLWLIGILRTIPRYQIILVGTMHVFYQLAKGRGAGAPILLSYVEYGYIKNEITLPLLNIFISSVYMQSGCLTK